MSKVTKLTFAFVALMATMLLAICPAYAQGTEVPPPPQAILQKLKRKQLQKLTDLDPTFRTLEFIFRKN